jgi:hypothetical protein
LRSGKGAYELTLILVSPCLVGREILSVCQRDVDSVKRSQEILGTKELGEDVDNCRLRSHAPSKVLVRGTVCLNETLLVDDGKTFFLDSRRVVSVVSQVERLEPLVDLVDVLVASLDGKHALDDGVAISVQVVSEITIVLVRVEAVQYRRASDGGCGFVGFGFVDHVARCVRLA